MLDASNGKQPGQLKRHSGIRLRLSDAAANALFYYAPLFLSIPTNTPRANPAVAVTNNNNICGIVTTNVRKRISTDAMFCKNRIAMAVKMTTINMVLSCFMLAPRSVS